MNTTNVNGNERRQLPRSTISAAAVAMQGATTVSGTVRDTSGGGVFFEPECGYVDGNVLSGPMIAAMIGDGFLMITIQDETGHDFVLGRVAARWCGYSDTHHTHGVGLAWQSC